MYVARVPHGSGSGHRLHVRTEHGSTNKPVSRCVGVCNVADKVKGVDSKLGRAPGSSGSLDSDQACRILPGMCCFRPCHCGSCSERQVSNVPRWV